MAGFVPMPSSLLASLQGKPNLGDWNDCLQYLLGMAGQLPVWGKWLNALRSEHHVVDVLIAARNRICHPDYVVELEFLANVESQFAEFFGNIFPKLRMEADSTEVLLSKSRKVWRDSDSRVTCDLDCLDLKSAAEPFPSIMSRFPEAAAREIAEEVIFCVRGEQLVFLANFFVVQRIKGDAREFFVYDKDYEGGKGQVVGVATGLCQRIDLPDGVFFFA